MPKPFKPLIARVKVRPGPGDHFPPGPRIPAALQTPFLWLARPHWMSFLHRRYGTSFTLRELGAGRIVVLSDPLDVKAVFTGSPDVFLAGEGNALLGPIVGDHSVLLLDRAEHLRERKLQLPAFHGESIARTVALMREVTAVEVRTWPVGEPFALHALLHAQDRHFPQAAEFRPERWLHETPEPYTWIPFGGGVRRCLGATFALTEMAEVLRTVLTQVDIVAVGESEATRVNHITLVPARGARVLVRRRLEAGPGDPAGTTVAGTLTPA